jgi:hypothetical protein
MGLRRSDVLVISAGLGARKPHELIPSYAATFDMHSLDAVGRRILTDEPRTTASRWWELLSTGLDASIRSRLTTRPSPAILITALSDPYLEAIRQELEDLSQEFIGTIVLGARRGPRRARFISLKPGIRLSLGGSSFSTSVRVASAILNRHEAHPFEGTSEIEEFVQNLQAKSPDFHQVNRRRLSDAEIIAFIREQIRSNGSTTKSSCLRALRNSGLACEQGRFSLLFSQARAI